VGFFYDSRLTALSIFEGDVSLSEKSLLGCQINNVAIKGHDISLDSRAFSDFKRMTKLHIDGSRVTMGEGAFHTCRCQQLVICGEIYLKTGPFNNCELPCVNLSGVLLKATF
jgi:hypothetical protein